ncbi:hypothetical protein CCMA1212_009962 [Trichoderma ghanense]|uniref:Uncharacterized protein n=1 Tax=Trichoderma ghanense TaxID=65468 RepID=A0ABY2GS76_9HYPO
MESNATQPIVRERRRRSASSGGFSVLIRCCTRIQADDSPSRRQGRWQMLDAGHAMLVQMHGIGRDSLKTRCSAEAKSRDESGCLQSRAWLPTKKPLLPMPAQRACPSHVRQHSVTPSSAMATAASHS